MLFLMLLEIRYFGEVRGAYFTPVNRTMLNSLVLYHVNVQLVLYSKLVSTLRTHYILLALMNHDVSFQAGHAIEFLKTLWTPQITCQMYCLV